MNLVETIRQHGANRGSQTAFCILSDDFVGDSFDEGAHIAQRITYAELVEQASRLAFRLEQLGLGGQRIVLPYAADLEFIVALFGCWWAGAVVTPVAPARGIRGRARLGGMLDDLEPQAILAAPGHEAGWEATKLQQPIQQLSFRELMAESGQPSAGWSPQIDGASLAVVQYTSGSTSQPKGVMLSHDHLARHCEELRDFHGVTSDSRGVVWTPAHHDMGLIGGILLPAAGGAIVCLMRPEAFLQKPLRWLGALDGFRATHTAAPAFGYDRCTRGIASTEALQLDLSHLQCALIGAEPVYPEIVERFVSRFGRHGFPPRAFCPAYGLAEATLQVTCSRRDAPPRILKLDRRALQRGRAVDVEENHEGENSRVTSCGVPWESTEVAIVDPATRTKIGDGQVGEIWVRGPSVAAGYWNRAGSRSSAAFQACLASGEGPFLATGDFGFLNSGELFVTGRDEDRMILRGANYLSPDLERALGGVHEAVCEFSIAAFEIAVEQSAELVVVLELKPEHRHELGRAEEVFREVRERLSREVDCAPLDIALVSPGGVPKTSSGKVRRQETRRQYLSGELKVRIRSRTSAPGKASPEGQAQEVSAESLVAWLDDYAKTLDTRTMDERRTIQPHVLADFGARGFMGMLAPKQYGGIELDAAGAARVVERLATYDLTLALVVGLQNCLGIQPILKFGDAACRERYLPDLAAGRTLASFALTEPDSGSHPSNLASRADQVEGGWRLSGHQCWIGNAAQASVYIVFVQSHDRAGQALGVTAFTLPRGCDGIRQGAEMLTMGMRAMLQNDLHLHDVAAPDDAVLGRVGEGMAVALDAVNLGRIAIAAMSLGGIRRCLATAADHAAHRQIVTGRLLDNPLTRRKLTLQLCAVRMLEALIGKAAAEIDARGAISEVLCLVSKIVGPELLGRAADDTLQLLGARGYDERNLISQLFRDARGLRIFEGPTEALQYHLGSIVAADPHAFCRRVSVELDAPETALGFSAAVEQLDFRRSRSRRKTSQSSPHAPREENVSRSEKTTLTDQDVQDRQLRIHELGALAAWYCAAAVLESEVSGNETSRIAYEWLVDSATQELHQGAMWADMPEIRFFDWLEQHAAPAQNSKLQKKSVQKLPRREVARAPASQETSSTVNGSEFDCFEWQEWLRGWIANRLALPLEAVVTDAPLTSLGVDSVIAVEMADAISKRTKLELTETVAWNYPTLELLARYLSGAPQDASGFAEGSRHDGP